MHSVQRMKSTAAHAFWKVTCLMVAILSKNKATKTIARRILWKKQLPCRALVPVLNHILQISWLSLPHLMHFLHAFLHAVEEKGVVLTLRGFNVAQFTRLEAENQVLACKIFKHGFAAIAYMSWAAMLKNFIACLYLMIKPWYRKRKVFKTLLVSGER